MKLFVFVSFLVVATIARPDVSHLLNQPSNAYLPSLSGNIGVSSTTSSPIVQSSIFTTGAPSSPSITTFVPKIIRPSPSTETSGFVAITPSTPTINYGVSAQQANVPSLRIDTRNSGISGQFVHSSTTPSSISVGTSPHLPSISLPHQQITETRFVETKSNLPTGSYLPTSGIISNVFQGSQSGGDGTFLNVPGVQSVQHVGGQSHKSVYFFAAPDEEVSQSRLRINILPSSQSSTRVIFIKAPTYAAPIPEVYSAPSETSDKTLIYVLSRKPDAGSAISIPANTVVKPTKPEIFFIKYGSQQEAQDAISTGLSGQFVGENLQDLLNERTFIDALKDVSSNIGSSVIIKGPGSTTTSSGISGGTVSVTTVRPTKVPNFGPAGDSGPY